MPLIIPNNLPASGTLEEENIFTMNEARAITQDIRPLEIAIVNLMPTKIATETQIARVLANSPLQVRLTLVMMGSHTARNTSQRHLETFYTTLDEIKHKRFDGMILTGAPVEQMPFEQVDYWDELVDIFDYSEKNVYSRMFICWGAQAGLYYYYGIDKHDLDEKICGVFPHRVTRPHNPLVRGFDEVFYSPHSRHTEIKREDILKEPALRILADSEEAGPHIISTENGKEIFILGHQEYDRNTLADEYERDKAKGLNPKLPKHYFEDDDPTKEPLFRWRGHASLLFINWLNYYVYQATPYNLGEL